MIVIFQRSNHIKFYRKSNHLVQFPFILSQNGVKAKGWKHAIDREIWFNFSSYVLSHFQFMYICVHTNVAKTILHCQTLIAQSDLSLNFLWTDVKWYWFGTVPSNFYYTIFNELFAFRKQPHICESMVFCHQIPKFAAFTFMFVFNHTSFSYKNVFAHNELKLF